MKFRVMFKTPDALHETLKEIEKSPGDDDAKYALKESVKWTFNKFTRYGELIEIEFDTDTQTCEVVSKR